MRSAMGSFISLVVGLFEESQATQGLAGESREACFVSYEG